jgi:hypothetical protein
MFETCHFLAIDFDEAGWQDDVTALREVCAEFDIPGAVERSQSGNCTEVEIIWKQEVGGSNPLAPTSFNHPELIASTLSTTSFFLMNSQKL